MRHSGVSDEVGQFVESTVNRAKDEILALVSARVADQLEDIIREAVQAAINDVIPEMVAHAIDLHVKDKHFWRQEYPDEKNLPFKLEEFQRRTIPEVT